MRKLTLFTALLLLSCHSVSWAEQDSAAIFNFVNEPMLAEYGQQLGSMVYAADLPGFDEEADESAKLDLNNYDVQVLLHDWNVKDISFAEFELENLLNAQQADELQPATVGDEGPFSGIPVRELSLTEDSQGVQNVTARVGAKNEGNMALLVDNEHATGLIQYNDVVYHIKHMYGKWHAFTTLNETMSDRIFDEDVALTEESDTNNRDGVESPDALDDSSCDASSTDVATIDLMVAYTPEAKKESLDAVVDIETQIKLASVVSNIAFKNSGIKAQFNVLQINQVDYIEDAGPKYFREDIEKLKKGDGGLQPLLVARKNLKADIAVLVAHNDHPGRCGIAGGINVTKKNALAVVNWKCMSNKFSYAHEIGHLAGARHDNDPNLPKHAHGFFTADNPEVKFGTIMATQKSCITSGCGRIWNWSNPHVDHHGVATGTAEKNNNACTWNTNVVKLSKFNGG